MKRELNALLLYGKFCFASSTVVVLLLSAVSSSEGDLGKASVLVQAIKPKVLLPSSFEHVHRQLGARPSSIANILLLFHFLDLNVSAQKAWQTPQWLVSTSCQCRIARVSRGVPGRTACDAGWELLVSSCTKAPPGSSTAVLVQKSCWI